MFDFSRIFTTKRFYKFFTIMLLAVNLLCAYMIIRSWINVYYDCTEETLFIAAAQTIFEIFLIGINLFNAINLWKFAKEEQYPDNLSGI